MNRVFSRKAASNMEFRASGMVSARTLIRVKALVNEWLEQNVSHQKDEDREKRAAHVRW